jgi:hypothetical protein
LIFTPRRGGGEETERPDAQIRPFGFLLRYAS